MTIQWDNKFIIGNPQIDHQHQQLFKIANRFLAATTQEEQLHCADSLVEYTHSHFFYEEMLMRKLHFAMLEQHLQSHHFLISPLEEVKDQIQKIPWIAKAWKNSSSIGRWCISPRMMRS